MVRETKKGRFSAICLKIPKPKYITEETFLDVRSNASNSLSALQMKISDLLAEIIEPDFSGGEKVEVLFIFNEVRSLLDFPCNGANRLQTLYRAMVQFPEGATCLRSFGVLTDTMASISKSSFHHFGGSLPWTFFSIL